MTVTIRAFASARDLLGTGSLRYDLELGATVGELWRRLCEQHPELERFQLRGLAVNRTYVEPDHKLADGDEVAIIPPVSGG